MLNGLAGILDLGGPVVMILLAVSVLTVAVVLYKIWHFSAAGVGRHRALRTALELWDAGNAPGAVQQLGRARSYLAPVLAQTMRAGATPEQRGRIEAELETRFTELERGLRILDTVSQLAPLLGLFGTVLGMIDAFQALQAAGSSVDPALLAGGIWTALLTTAVALAVAMPAALALSWLDGRMDRERVFADLALGTILTPHAEAVPQREERHAAE